MYGKGCDDCGAGRDSVNVKININPCILSYRVRWIEHCQS